MVGVFDPRNTIVLQGRGFFLFKKGRVIKRVLRPEKGGFRSNSLFSFEAPMKPSPDLQRQGWRAQGSDFCLEKCPGESIPGQKALNFMMNRLVEHVRDDAGACRCRNQHKL